ncbi:venom serine carboxypeptidase-like [Dermacentor andersoni]|uniref:venom serine carboxypeptidase-like n=1 Tax=Dermacentor andersoni TaxID=34620 RepID=UPI0024179BE4|nr:venom serine carboxypeptidase-like [Dermacentor andersoni]
MKLHQFSKGVLISAAILTACKCNTENGHPEPSFAATRSASPECAYINETESDEDLLLYPTNDRIPPEDLLAMRLASRVCLPKPCDNLRAFSGFIPVNDDKTSYLFFLLIKATHKPWEKPLLLWLQGGPGKSSLFGQFLENGPLGINASGTLYHRHHTLVEQFHVIYLDQPVGSGYSFNTENTYPSTLEEASVHIMRFLRRFLRLFPEYYGRSFYIAGESYGARSAIGVAQKVSTRYPWELPLRFEGVMLGVGFLFPLLKIINSTDYLYYAGLLDEHGRHSFAQQFNKIQSLVQAKQFQSAAMVLSQTVLNMHVSRQPSLFEKLTGFEHHGSIIRPRRPAEVEAYKNYANSEEFKKIIHVDPSRALDSTRMQIAMQLAVGDFFVDQEETLLSVLNSRHVLLYTAQLDAVFPAVNLERCFRELNWRGRDMFKTARRRFWHRDGNSSLELLGYEKRVGTVMFNTVLFGGHYVSLDQSSAISDLYSRFLTFTATEPPSGNKEQAETDKPPADATTCIEELSRIIS